MTRKEDIKPHWTKIHAINLYAKDIEMIDELRLKTVNETGKVMSRSRFMADIIREHLGYTVELNPIQRVKLFNVDAKNPTNVNVKQGGE